MHLYSCIGVVFLFGGGGVILHPKVQNRIMCALFFNMQAHRKIYQRLHILFIFTF